MDEQRVREIVREELAAHEQKRDEHFRAALKELPSNILSINDSQDPATVYSLGNPLLEADSQDS